MIDPEDGDVLVRRMDVTARIPNEVLDLSDLAEDGLLIEQLIGRYVLNSDARMVWAFIDGARTVHDIATETATAVGLKLADVLPAVRELSGRLVALGLLEHRQDGF